MLKFLLKGLIRDKSRSLFPIIVVSSGVLIIVYFLAFMGGYQNGMIRQNARYDTGHVKIVTKAYSELINQKPYDLGFLDLGDALKVWEKEYPEFNFVQRINFGALLDVPNEQGETKTQGEVVGYGLDLLNSTLDIENLNLDKALVKGSLIKKAGEILVSDQSFNRLGLKLGDKVTLIGSTVYGSMSFQNFIICGTVNFGFEMLDRGAVIADLSDIRQFLDMSNGCGEILGFLKKGNYSQDKVDKVKTDFNHKYRKEKDDFSPEMLTLTDQNNLGAMLKMMSLSMNIINVVFIVILGIVLWNSGLMNGIRRYGEIGIRLAMGEEKGHVYLSLVGESLIIGITGSLIGVFLGILVNIYFSKYGMDISAYNRESSILVENVIYSSLDFKSCLLGFIPGVVSTLSGSLLAGLVIFKRKTSQLFKELEV